MSETTIQDPVRDSLAFQASCHEVARMGTGRLVQDLRDGSGGIHRR